MGAMNVVNAIDVMGAMETYSRTILSFVILVIVLVVLWSMNGPKHG
jgi:hypothetical protein